jgi:hypothetical protein
MKTPTTFKSFLILVVFMALGSTISFAQQKQALKSKPKPAAASNVKTTTTTPAKTNTVTQPAPAKVAPSNASDISDMEQQRSAISEQGMPSDQPKMKPATSTNVPVSNNPTPVKPKTESNSPTVTPK